VPEDLGGDKTNDRPRQREDATRARPRFDLQVERTRPEGRRALPSHEREHQPPGLQSPEEPQKQARPKRKRLIIAAIIGAVLLIAGVGLGWYCFTTWRWLESTDDAYTQADNTTISSKIAGYVAELLVTDNQSVKARDVLLRLDAHDYQATFDQAHADVLAADADIHSLDEQIAQQQATIEQARADVAAAEANLAFSQQEYARYQELARTGAGTVQRAQQAAADLQEKTATLKHNQANLLAAEKQIAVLQRQRAKAEATLLHNRAVLDQARLNLDYTVITSPIDGAVGDRSARVGQYVQPGVGLMTIVPMGAGIYVVANFKETQIGRMFRGESVDLTVDAFPGVHLHGTIDSLAPGSGAVFALLPPENATGNFTKIVQRVPVKILIDPEINPVLDRLRPGLSVVATVDTRTAPPQGARTLVPPSSGE
jgi:membrane fusion protein (multidrug efflux system)